MKKLNKDGYMLVEIIMAFAIVFILIYFIMDLVIDVKNKNDDLLVDTLTRTDQTIITNKLMDYIIDETSEVENIIFDCSKLEVMEDNITIKYKDDVIGIINEYAVINRDDIYCSTDQGKVSIKIPIDVKQVDEDYDVLINYKYDIGDMTPPILTFDIEKSSNKYFAVIKCEDDESGIVGDAITKQELTGTSNVSISHVCVNEVGLTTTGEHIYKSKCASSQYVCGTCYKFADYYTCRQYSTATTTPLCGGIPGCVDCYKPSIPYDCNCGNVCNLWMFEK